MVPSLLAWLSRLVRRFRLISSSPARVKVYDNKAVTYVLSMLREDSFRHTRLFATMGSLQSTQEIKWVSPTFISHIICIELSVTRVHLLGPMKGVVLTEFVMPNSSSAAVIYAERVTSSLTPPCERKSIIKDPSHLQDFNLFNVLPSNRHFPSVKFRTTSLKSCFPLHKWLWSITSPCNHVIIPPNAVTASHLI